MNSLPISRLDMLAASLARLQARLPSTPVPKIMLSRMLVELGRGMVGFELYHRIVQGVSDLVLEPVSFVCKPPLEGIGKPIEIVKQAFGVVVRLGQHVNPADILIEAHVVLVKLD